MKPRRTILSVPGNKETMHEKAISSNVDVIMLDLEDSVSVDEKNNARNIVAASIKKNDFSKKTLTIRINPVDTGFCYSDIIDIFVGCGELIDSIVIPKVNNASEVHFVHHLLEQIEAKHRIKNRIAIEASIETAQGLENIESIAKSSDRIISLVFGIADYTASIGARLVSVSGHGEGEEEIYPGYRFGYVSSKIVNTAKANDLLAIDAPYGNFRDVDGLKRSTQISAALGFDGKWAIHPAQIDVINKIFSPDIEDIERAKLIMETYEKAVLKGFGSAQYDGRMIDKATYSLAKKLIYQAKYLGMTE